MDAVRQTRDAPAPLGVCMSSSTGLRSGIAVAIAALALPMALAAPAVAAPAQHESLPASNLVLECAGGTVYTGTDGELKFVSREGESASGGRFGATVTLDHVLVSDGTDTYRAIGSAVFGGGEKVKTGAVSDRGVFHIQVLGDRGPIAAVKITARLLDDGSIWLNDHGDCAQP